MACRESVGLLGVLVKAFGRTVLWNAFGLAAAVLAVVAGGEAYLRATRPFPEVLAFTEVVPRVGKLLKPYSKVHATDHKDFWNVARANSLGFLDREPISPERAKESCHVAVVGDSYVHASEVGLDDKFHIRLERMAAERLPELDVTTAAYGFKGTGQVAQLPWWDKWIRHRPPKLLVLVFVFNDFVENGVQSNLVSAERREGGDGFDIVVHPRVHPPTPRTIFWSRSGTGILWASAEFVSGVLPEYSSYWFNHQYRMVIWRRDHAARMLRKKEDEANGPPAPLRKDEWEPTVFAVDQWQARTDSAGAHLVALSTHSIGDNWRFRTALRRLTASRDIPVVDQLDYIMRQGGEASDAHWPEDYHWNPQGHQWAAEALLEWLVANPWVCSEFS